MTAMQMISHSVDLLSTATTPYTRHRTTKPVKEQTIYINGEAEGTVSSVVLEDASVDRSGQIRSLIIWLILTLLGLCILMIVGALCIVKGVCSCLNHKNHTSSASHSSRTGSSFVSSSSSPQELSVLPYRDQDIGVIITRSARNPSQIPPYAEAPPPYTSGAVHLDYIEESTTDGAIVRPPTPPRSRRRIIEPPPYEIRPPSYDGDKAQLPLYEDVIHEHVSRREIADDGNSADDITEDTIRESRANQRPEVTVEEIIPVVSPDTG